MRRFHTKSTSKLALTSEGTFTEDGKYRAREAQTRMPHIQPNFDLGEFGSANDAKLQCQLTLRKYEWLDLPTPVLLDPS